MSQCRCKTGFFATIRCARQQGHPGNHIAYIKMFKDPTSTKKKRISWKRRKS